MIVEGDLPRPVGMIGAGQKRVSVTLGQILFALSAIDRTASRPRLSLITLFRTKGTRKSFGMNRTGKAYAPDTITRRRRERMGDGEEAN